MLFKPVFITLIFSAPLKLIHNFKAQEMPEFYLQFRLGNFYYFENYIIWQTLSDSSSKTHEMAIPNPLVLRILFSTRDLAVPIFIALPTIWYAIFYLQDSFLFQCCNYVDIFLGHSMQLQRKKNIFSLPF